MKPLGSTYQGKGEDNAGNSAARLQAGREDEARINGISGANRNTRLVHLAQ